MAVQQPENNAEQPQQEQKPIDIKINQADLEKQRLENEDIDFMRDSKAALLSKSTPLANIVLYVLIIFIITGFIWSRIAKLDEITRGMGKVVPSSKVQVIQNLEGGILSKVFVNEGEIVDRDQILLQLDDTRFASQYHQGYTQYLALQANIARLKAETRNKDQVTFPPEVKENLQLVEQATDLFNSKKQLLKNTLENLHTSYQLAKHELNITEPLVKEGVMSKVELLRLQREVNTLKTKLDSYKDNFYETELVELNKYQAEAIVLAEHLAALKDRKHRTTIRSPVNGIVKQIYYNTLGGVIEPAKPIMEVVPLNDDLIIEAQVLPKDIAFIKVGQQAKVKVTAYDYAIYGGLDAKVTHVSADTSIDPQGHSYYEVTLKTIKNYLGTNEGSLSIRPGMTAQVDIITGKKPVLSYLLKPLLRAKEKAMRER